MGRKAKGAAAAAEDAGAPKAAPAAKRDQRDLFEKVDDAMNFRFTSNSREQARGIVARTFDAMQVISRRFATYGDGTKGQYLHHHVYVEPERGAAHHLGGAAGTAVEFDESAKEYLVELAHDRSRESVPAAALQVDELADGVECIRGSSLCHESMYKLDALQRKHELHLHAATQPEAADEPPFDSADDIKHWYAWARREAEMAANAEHPREAAAVRGAHDEAAAAHEGELLPLRCSLDHLAETVGVVPRLYLELLKLSGGFFAIAYLVSLPSLVASSIHFAEAFPEHNEPLSENFFGGIGNLFFQFLALASQSVGARLECGSDACKSINLFTAIAEVLLCLLFVLAFTSFQEHLREVAAQADMNAVHVHEYTVRLSGLPSRATPLQVKAHIEATMRAYVVRMLAKVRRRLQALEAKPKKKQGDRAIRALQEAVARQEVADLEKLQQLSFYKVHDVTLILDYGEILNALQETTPAAQRLRRRMRKLQKAHLLGNRHQIEDASHALDEAREAVADLYQRLAHTDFTTHIGDVCGAYITLEYQAGKQLLLEMLSGGMRYALQPAYIRFPDGGPPKEAMEAVTPTFEPSTAGPPEATLSSEASLDACASKYAAFRVPGLFDRRIRAVAACHPMDTLFENQPYQYADLLELLLQRSAKGFATLLRRFFARTLLLLLLLISAVVIVMLKTLSGDVTDMLNSTSTVINATTGVETVEATTADDESLLKLAAGALGGAVALTLVATNELLRILVIQLAGYERHSSISSRDLIIVFQLFLATVLNYGLTPILVEASSGSPAENHLCVFCDAPAENDQGNSYCCLIGPDGFLLRGSYMDMTSGWYLKVGALVQSALILQILVNVALPLGHAAKFHLKRIWLSKSKVLLEDMQQLYTRPPLNFPKLIARAYAVIFVVYMYAAAIPNMYLVGVIYCLVQYGMVKYSLLRIYRSPPKYKVEVLDIGAGFRPFAAFLHLGLGWWAYSAAPGYTLDGGKWEAPWSENATSSVNFTDANVAAIDGTLNLSDHLNSWGALSLFLGALGVFALICLAFLIQTLLHVFPLSRDDKMRLRSCARAIRRLIYPCFLPKRASVADVSGAKLPSDESAEADSEETMVDAEKIAAETVVQHTHETDDPALSLCLRPEGVEHPGLRVLPGGRVVHSHMVIKTRERLPGWRGVCQALRRALCACVTSPGDTSMFLLSGMHVNDIGVSQKQWDEADQAVVRLVGSHNVSYEPEFSPMWKPFFRTHGGPRDEARGAAASSSAASEAAPAPTAPPSPAASAVPLLSQRQQTPESPAQEAEAQESEARVLEEWPQTQAWEGSELSVQSVEPEVEADASASQPPQRDD